MIKTLRGLFFLGRVWELWVQQILPNLRSMQGAFVKVYRGISSKRNEAGGEKAVKGATERVFRHALPLNSAKCNPFNDLLLSNKKDNQ